MSCRPWTARWGRREGVACPVGAVFLESWPGPELPSLHTDRAVLPGTPGLAGTSGLCRLQPIRTPRPPPSSHTAEPWAGAPSVQTRGLIRSRQVLWSHCFFQGTDD